MSEYEDDEMKSAEMLDIIHLLNDLNQKVRDGRKFDFDRQGFNLGLMNHAYELEEKDTDLFKDVLKKTSKDYPVAYGYSESVFRNLYEFLDETAEDGMGYEITDIYDVHI